MRPLDVEHNMSIVKKQRYSDVFIVLQTYSINAKMFDDVAYCLCVLLGDKHLE